jgi:hypothetical protein
MYLLTSEIVFTLIAYTAGTLFGIYWQRERNQNSFNDIVEATIDSLIRDDYIKTRGVGDDMELLKYWEE